MCIVGVNSRRPSVDRQFGRILVNGKNIVLPHGRKIMISDADLEANRSVVFVPGLDSFMKREHSFRLVGDYGVDKPLVTKVKYVGKEEFSINEISMDYLEALPYKELIKFAFDNFGDRLGIRRTGMKKTEVMSILTNYLIDNSIDITPFIPDEFAVRDDDADNGEGSDGVDTNSLDADDDKGLDGGE